MGKESRLHKQAVIEGKEKPHGGIIQKMKDTANGMKEDIRSRMGNEILIGVMKLVKEDVKKGKVKDAEAYIAKCKNDLRPGTKAGNMVKNSGISLEEIESTIRATLKDNPPALKEN